jgi:UDP-N-acetylmuramate dehydrogenase
MTSPILRPETLSLESSYITPYVPLADKNWFRTGGVARYFAEPHNAEEFQGAVMTAQALELPIYLIGEGANMLVSDEGIDGLVIRPQLKSISAVDIDNQHSLVTAGAGISFPDLITWCLNAQLLGLEEFSGIPGTVGGAVFINIHYFEFLLGQFMTGGQVIEKETGKLLSVDTSWFEFGYNTSKLHTGKHYLVSATFKLAKVDRETASHARGRSLEMIRHRAKRYPTSHTCGSFFRNFTPQEVAHTNRKLIFVAYYLDKLGIKGELTVGGAQVSHQHANMIVNRGTATTNDILHLARSMQQRVYDAFGMIPQPECRLMGFKDYPLLSYD